MALHRLTSITLGVPSPADSGSFFRQFGLDETAPGRFSTRDGGEQLVLEQNPRRSLHRLGVGALDGDDIERIARNINAWSAAVPCDRPCSR